MGEPAPVPAVHFLTDFGTDDPFVGVVHAVLHRLAPGVPVLDLTHGVPAFDVVAGASSLGACLPYLGPGVVLAVVDPGVGTARRAVAVEVSPGPGPGWLVGPDNGLLAVAAEDLGGARRVVVLDRDRAVPSRADGIRSGGAPTAVPGPTFDGRDLFAPAAAHLVRGGDPAALGPEAAPSSLVPAPTAPHRPLAVSGPGRGLVGAVRSVDRFGNVALDLAPDDLDAAGLTVGATGTLAADAGSGPSGGEPVRRVVAFGDLAPGGLGVLVDSSGCAAVVLDRGSAAARLGLPDPATGVPVRLVAGPVRGTVAPG